MIAGHHTLGTQYEGTDIQQVRMSRCDDSHMLILLGSPTSISYGHSDVFAGPPMWCCAGKSVVALAARSIEDCPVVIRKSKSPSQNLLVRVAAS